MTGNFIIKIDHAKPSSFEGQRVRAVDIWNQWTVLLLALLLFYSGLSLLESMYFTSFWTKIFQIAGLHCWNDFSLCVNPFPWNHLLKTLVINSIRVFKRYYFILLAEIKLGFYVNYVWLDELLLDFIYNLETGLPTLGVDYS